MKRYLFHRRYTNFNLFPLSASWKVKFNIDTTYTGRRPYAFPAVAVGKTAVAHILRGEHCAKTAVARMLCVEITPRLLASLEPFDEFVPKRFLDFDVVQNRRDKCV